MLRRALFRSWNLILIINIVIVVGFATIGTTDISDSCKPGSDA